MLRYLFKCFAIEFDSQEIFIESKKINLNMLKLQLNVSNQPSNKWCKYSQREEKIPSHWVLPKVFAERNN